MENTAGWIGIAIGLLIFVCSHIYLYFYDKRLERKAEEEKVARAEVHAKIQESIRNAFDKNGTKESRERAMVEFRENIARLRKTL